MIFRDFLLKRTFLTQVWFDLTFCFCFSGFPQPEYRWMKDGMFLSDFSSEHFYKIQAVSKSDAGNYQCYAKNSVGTIISESIPLTVACKIKAVFSTSNFKGMIWHAFHEFSELLTLVWANGILFKLKNATSHKLYFYCDTLFINVLFARNYQR